MKEFNTVRRVVSGAGCLSELGAEVARLAGRKVLIISDPGIEAAGLVDAASEILSKSGLKHVTFTKVEPEPTLAVVQASLEQCEVFAPDIIIGLGGGSSLDIAKVTSMMMVNPGPIDRYFGLELVPKPGPPLILIPTTAGTGSEVTSICVLADPRSQTKKGIVSEHLFAAVAMLDPELTLGLPPRVTAMTGMDALSHALESYTGTRSTEFTDTLNFRAIELIAGNLRQAFANGKKLEARENMLNASCLAGMAFSNTQTALAHALAMTIGARHHMPHGLLTAFIMPWVMEFNLMANPEKFIKVARAFGENTSGLPLVEAARLSVKAIKSLLDDLGISYRLSSYDVPREEIPSLAEAAIANQQRLLSNNPREVSRDDMINILEENY